MGSALELLSLYQKYAFYQVPLQYCLQQWRRLCDHYHSFISLSVRHYQMAHKQ